jgi:hypothetical protein
LIEKIVSNHIGQTISLDDQRVQILKFSGTDVNTFKNLLSKMDQHDPIAR